VSYFWGLFSWIWSKRKFLLITLLSAIFFFAWFFPFSDLSDFVTSNIALATRNQVYLQFENLKVSLLPSPNISAANVSVETPVLPALEASNMELAPSWTSLIFNLWTIKKAAGGDQEAAAKLGTRLGATISAEGLMGADVELKLRPGSTTEQGNERSKISLSIEKLSLADFQKWSDLPVKMQGTASLDSTVQMTPGMTEQPEGEIDLRISKFNMPASTVMVPLGEAIMPVSLPNLTLANVLLRGRISNGKVTIEEGTFGQSKDPLNGRIKGNLFVKFQTLGAQVVPLWGAYTLTVDLNVTRAIEKEIGFAFLIFDSAKTPTGSGSRYLFQASGNGFGPPPSIARINSF
jgi:type II secretion system protein N